MFALLFLIVGIYFAYLAFLKLNHLSLQLTGKLLEEISLDITDTISMSIKHTNIKTDSYVSFVWKIIKNTFQNSASSFVSFQTSRITEIIYEALTFNIPNFQNTIQEICLNNIGGEIKTHWYDRLNSMVTSFVGIKNIQDCGLNTQKILIEQFYHDQSVKIQIFLLHVNKNRDDIISLINYSSYFLTSSLFYFAQRGWFMIYDLFQQSINSINSIKVINSINSINSIKVIKSSEPTTTKLQELILMNEDKEDIDITKKETNIIPKIQKKKKIERPIIFKKIERPRRKCANYN